MKLTTKGRYAVMAMADLASYQDGKPVSLTDISARQNISLSYLEQLFAKLKNEKLVDTFLNVILKCCPNTTIFTMYKSELWKQAKKKGITVWCEAFLDRVYTKNGNLQDRDEAGAILSDVNKIFMQLESMINKKKVKTNEGKWISIKADTFCLHGDHPNVIKNLISLNVPPTSFACIL